jgi:glycosyltransferase involved in cell wall biosynthesis
MASQITSPNSKKTIVALSHSSCVGGAELALKSLIESTSSDFSWVVVVASRNNVDKAARASNANYVSIDFPWWCHEAQDFAPSVQRKKLEENLNKLKDIVRKADLTLTNTITIPWMAVVAEELGKPHVWYVHEFGDIDHNLRFALGYDETLKFINHYSTRVITIGNAIKKHITRIIDVEKVDIIHQSIDMTELLSIPLNTAKPPRNYRFLCIGAIKPSKGQHVAVEAMRLVDRSNMTLSVVGPIANATYAQDLATTLPNNVVLSTGFSDAINQLSNHDVVLMCSANEGLGRVTLEALAAGKLVIGFGCDSTTELLSDGRGVIYSPNTPRELSDKILNIDTYYQNINRESARRYVSTRYNEHQQRDDFLTVIDKLLSSPSANEPTSRQILFAQLVFLDDGLFNSVRLSLKAGMARVIKYTPKPMKRFVKPFFHKKTSSS